MIQHNQVGKYKTKQSILDAKVGGSFVTPENRTFTFNYRKEGRRYIFILEYMGKRMQVSEPDYNLIPTDTLLKAMDEEIDNPII